PGLEPDEDPIGQRLVEMLGESQAKTLALDHVPNAAHDALARFAAHSADEGRAKTELARAEQARDETQERATRPKSGWNRCRPSALDSGGSSIAVSARHSTST